MNARLVPPLFVLCLRRIAAREQSLPGYFTTQKKTSSITLISDIEH